jgi:hypothetical protein
VELGEKKTKELINPVFGTLRQETTLQVLDKDKVKALLTITLVVVVMVEVVQTIGE